MNKLLAHRKLGTHFKSVFELLKLGSSKVYYAQSRSLVLLPSEAAALSKPCTASSGLAKNCGTPGAHNHCLGVAEHSGDPVAAGTLDVHEVGVGMLDKPLQLMLSLLLMVEGMEQVLGQRHLDFSLKKCYQA